MITENEKIRYSIDVLRNLLLDLEAEKDNISLLIEKQGYLKELVYQYVGIGNCIDILSSSLINQYELLK